MGWLWTAATALASRQIAPATVEARLKYLPAQAGWSGTDVGRFPKLDGKKMGELSLAFRCLLATALTPCQR